MNEAITLCEPTEAELRAAIVLTLLPGLGRTGARSAVAQAGTCRGALSRQAVFAETLHPLLQRADEELAYCQAQGISVLPLTAEAYPARLRETPDAPTVIYYRGTADLNARHVLAVVGTRHITDYGRDVVRRLTADLGRLVPDCLVVSGLAYGVDVHAHRGALEAGLPTLGVLAHGLDRLYPAAHRETAKRMVGKGGLVTEYPRGTTPERSNFLQRNRIIAGMADATLVVESARRGGALTTARLAQEYDRDVFAFPGRTTDTYSEGCNALIRSCRAALATSADDIVESLGWETATPADAAQPTLFPRLLPDEQSAYDALSDDRPRTPYDVAAAAGLPIGRATSALFALEMKGLARTLPGGAYRRLR